MTPGGLAWRRQPHESPRVLAATIRFLIGLGLGVTLLPLCAWVFERAVRHAQAGLPEDPIAALIGLLIGLAVIACWQPNWFVHTFLHESAHAIACVVLRVKLRSFRASHGKGGDVQFDACDPLRATLIAIAPYTLPLIPLPLLAAQQLAGHASWRWALTLLAVWGLVAHLHGLWHNLRLNFSARDGDLATTGRLLGLVLIACALLLTAAAAVRALW